MNEGPLARIAPPDNALYQLIVEPLFAVALNATVPVPQCEPVDVVNI